LAGCEAERRWPGLALLGAAMLLSIAVLLSVAACGGSAGGTADPNAPLLTLIRGSIAAENDEDLDAYMAFFHPDGPNYASIRASTQESFETYDLAYEVSDLEVLDVNAQVAHVRGVVTVTKLAGPVFRNYRITVTWEARKYKGVWKIYLRKLGAAEYLEPPVASLTPSPKPTSSVKATPSVTPGPSSSSSGVPTPSASAAS
jgi:hypothetical protein